MDTSGDQQFPAMRRLSIATAHAFLLVYAATSAPSFLSVKKCFEEIREQRADYQVSFCCTVLIQMNAHTFAPLNLIIKRIAHSNGSFSNKQLVWSRYKEKRRNKMKKEKTHRETEKYQQLKQQTNDEKQESSHHPKTFWYSLKFMIFVSFSVFFSLSLTHEKTNPFYGRDIRSELTIYLNILYFLMDSFNGTFFRCGSRNWIP